jgi:glutamate/aspartate transport system ATP-binding protein
MAHKDKFPVSCRWTAAARVRVRFGMNRSPCCLTNLPRLGPGDGRRVLDCMMGTANEDMTMMNITRWALPKVQHGRVIFMDVGGKILEDCSTILQPP